MYKVIELEIDPEISGDTGVFEVAWVEFPAIEQELMYFGEQKFFRAPDNVASKACRAIKENELRGNPAATQVGKIRGQQLCNKDEISLETIKRMKSYLERAATYYTGDYDDNGTISYDLWGGKPGLDWVDGILKKQEELGIQDFVYPRVDEKENEFISRCIKYVIEEGKTPEQAAGQCYGMWENRKFEKGVPHYTEDGELYEGPTHKDSSGRLMTEEVHSEDSEYLYHEGEFAEVGPRGGIRESKKAPKGDTPNKNPKGKGTAKGDASTSRGAEVSEKVEKILQEKADDFNERYKDKLGYGVNVGMLKSVYQRGVGAYNVSHSPAVKSSQQWALARVNAFLYLVKTGRPQNKNYKNDNDLLPSEHPKKDKFAATRVSFDWDDTLDTPRGEKLLQQELSRGSVIYIISARNIPSREMYDLSLKYNIPSSHIFTEGSNIDKIEKIKELGITRHYDNNFQVLKDLGTIGVRFDYDITGLPDYDNYPASGDTDAMLVKPFLYDEYCSCNDDFNEYDEYDFDEYTDEEIQTVKLLKFLSETDQEKFEAVISSMRGSTESEIMQRKHDKPVFYFKYDRVLDGFPDRDFCDSIENRYFRRLEIDLLQDTNKEFGHNREAYSKWLYKGGPNCVHAWRRFIYTPKEKNKEAQLKDLGMVSGKPGTPPKQMPNNGYYSEKTKRASEIAYIVSQQNMNSISYMKDIECAFGDMCKIELSEKQVFSAQDEERMIYTPLMIPNILIPRMDEVSNEKYFVKFKPEVIKTIRDKFMAELRNRKTNYEHTDKKFDDVVMVETWIVQGEKDKAYELGFTDEQIPVGTWMGAYKVLDTPEGNFVWDKYIKPGKVKGASVEGNFILNFSRNKTDEYLLEQVINILNKITD